MSTLCPHANCEIAWVEKDRQAECPCHGSRFAGDGTVLSGPAVTDLQTYPAILDASGSVVVNLFAGDKVFPPVTNGSVVIALADSKYRTLQSPGGAVVGHPDGAPSPIVVTRPDPPVTAQGGFLVFSALCTHLTCTVLPLTGRLHRLGHGRIIGSHATRATTFQLVPPRATGSPAQRATGVGTPPGPVPMALTASRDPRDALSKSSRYEKSQASRCDPKNNQFRPRAPMAWRS